MSSRYSIPAPPAFGLVLSPTPIVIFLTLLRLTPAALRSLSGIRHSVQADTAVAEALALTTVFDFPPLSSTRRYKDAGSLVGIVAPMASACHEPVTAPVVATLDISATVVRAASWLVTARPM